MSMNRRTIYLANPYGFSKQMMKSLLPPIIGELEGLGLEVWEPFQRNSQIDFAAPGSAYVIGQRDVADVRNADAIFAIVNGTPPDEGVMVELGIAVALRKPIFLFRDDFRRCSDSGEYPLNLMVFTGLPQDSWRSHFYESVEEIGAAQKALAQWARG